jgi:hypothetical protein
MPVILTIFIVFLTGMIPAYHQHQDNQLCKNASKAFIEAVINNDLDSAKNLSCGKISWQLQNVLRANKSKNMTLNVTERFRCQCLTSGQFRFRGFES